MRQMIDDGAFGADFTDTIRGQTAISTAPVFVDQLKLIDERTYSFALSAAGR